MTANITTISRVWAATPSHLDAAARRQAWEERLLPSVVENLVETICFKAVPGHEACAEFYFSLPDEERANTFYCLGVPNHCVNCDAEWFGTAVPRRQPNDNFTDENPYILVGSLVIEKCPNCLTPYETHKLQRQEWWQAVATMIAQLAKELTNKNQSYVTDWTTRLAIIVSRANLVPVGELKTIQDYKRYANQIRDWLVEAGIHDEDENGIVAFPTSLYDAINFVVYAPAGFDFLLKSGMESVANWRTEWEGWSLNDIRRWAKTLRAAVERKVLGDEPISVPEALAPLEEQEEAPSKSAVHMALRKAIQEGSSGNPGGWQPRPEPPEVHGHLIRRISVTGRERTFVVIPLKDGVNVSTVAMLGVRIR